MNIFKRMFQREPLENYLASDSKLERTLSAKDLMALGIGAVIGTGIFILPGTVASQHSGPAIIISFIIAAVICSISAMCYSELSSEIPVAGGAYSYGNVIFGEVVGWVLGWALFLEYMLTVAAVSTGWSAYFISLLRGFNITVPKAITGAFNPSNGTYINLFSMIIVVLIALVISTGSKNSARLNNIIVLVKIAVIVLFILVGAFYVKPTNWIPFMPFGWSGVLQGASLVFFAYVGFDGVSASAAEVKNPKRDMPIGIIGTLVVCTGLYILVSLVLTGMMSYTKLNVDDPVAFVLQAANLNWVAGIVSIGALAGMFTSMVTMMLASSRLLYSVGRDGLLPDKLSKLDNKHHTPINAIVVVTIIIAILSGFLPLEKLTSLVNIGTLVAFLFVSIGVLVFRKQTKNNKQATTGYKVPFYPALPIISVLLCALMLYELPLDTWIAAGIWFVIGLVIYFSYGIKHSKLNKIKSN